MYLALIFYNLRKIENAKLYYEKDLKVNANLTAILSEKELTTITVGMSMYWMKAIIRLKSLLSSKKNRLLTIPNMSNC